MVFTHFWGPADGFALIREDYPWGRLLEWK